MVSPREHETQILQDAKLDKQELMHILGGFVPVGSFGTNCNGIANCAEGCQRECKTCKEGCQHSSKEGTGGNGITGPIKGDISTES